MSSTSTAAATRRPDPAGASVSDPWSPALSRIVLRKAAGNRRVAPSRSRSAKELLDACGRAARRCVPALIGLLLIGAFSGAAALSHHWVTTSPRFAIRSIEVQGTHVLTAEAVASLLPLHVGDNMFDVDTRALEGVLRSNPWIARAEVHRELPRTMVATIVERTPVALVDLGAPYLVEANGAPFKRAALELGEGDRLPVISGIERLAFRADPVATKKLIRAGLAAISTWRAAPGRPAVDEVSFDAFGGLTLHTHQPELAVHLGALDDPTLAQRMSLFEPAWAKLSADEQARTESIYLDAGLSQATIAFAKN